MLNTRPTPPTSGHRTPAHPAHPAHQAAHPTQHAKSDPAVLKIQQDLIAKGYPLKADGIMGPQTQAAMDWQAKSDARDAGLQAIDNMDPNQPAQPAPTDPAKKAAYDAAMRNMDPNQTPAQSAPAPAGASAITPKFQSQQQSQDDLYAESIELDRILQLATGKTD